MKNPVKSHNKRKLCIQHRKGCYEHWLDKLLNNEAKPEEVTARWQKLQQIKK